MAERIAWIEICGVTLGGADEADAGLVWEDLTGWWGLPDGRGSRDTIPGGHGAFARTRVLREARVLALKGFIMGQDRASFIQSRNRLTAALAAGVGLMRVATDEGVWDRMIEVDTLEIDPDHGDVVTDFTVDLVAPDPRRYGPWQTVGPVGLPTSEGGLEFPAEFPWDFGTTSPDAFLTVANGGQIDIGPRMRVTGGGMTRTSIINVRTGDRLTLAWPVPEGSDVVFDSAARRVWIGEQDVTRWLTARQWFTIPAGSTHEFRFEATGGIDPLLTAEFRIGAW